MPATEKTTAKIITLGYRPVGSLSTVEYTPIKMLKGVTISMDNWDEVTVSDEASDTPHLIYYNGKPLKVTFELPKYRLSDLVPIFGGTYTAAGTAIEESYEASIEAHTTELEWQIGFTYGNRYLVISRGLTMGIPKKDADGAFNYSVTITALTYDDGTAKHTYKIIGDAATGV